MNRTAATIAAVLLAVTLTGCSAPASAPDPDAVQQTTRETPAPLVAEPSAPADHSPEQVYLDKLRAAFDRDGTSIPDATDEQLLDAGERACEQLAEGKSTSEVRVVEGEQPLEATGSYVDSARIAAGASEYLCD